jgi:kinetochore protein Spc7/SPC105
MAGEEDDGASSGSDDEFDGESTAMSMDDVTARSSMTVQSDATSSSSSSARLNEALRQAAKEAGTEAVEEDGEVSMEIVDTEITGAFQPWIKKGQRQSFDWEDISARHDQENMDPSKGAASGISPESDDHIDEDEEMSMDVTSALGRILGKPPGRRQSTRRKSTAEESSYDDQTMEMTNVVGGIMPQDSPSRVSEIDDDEGMTMEFTSGVGKILGNEPSDRMNDDQDDESEDGMDMEMTGAIGGILQSGQEANDKVHAKLMMELETDSGQLNSSPFQESVRQSPAKSPTKSPLRYQIAAVASESGSPSLTSVRARPSRRSSVATSTPRSASHHASPANKTSTPPKQSTPQTKPTTPSKTPPSSAVTFRSASPKKLFKPEIQQSADKRKSLRQSLFEHNAATGESTPLFKLQPREARRSSGLGIDKEGLGSPRVAAILDKRQSLGDSTPQFVPQEQTRSGVRFEDPLQMQAEEERDREEEELREDGHLPMPHSEDRDVTSNLKDMIQSLSPKKTKIGSRKSLHVGAARGILGKRPAELDLDEDEYENSPKRLRGHNVSPVKGVKLPAPTPREGSVQRTVMSPARRAVSSSPLKGSTTPSHEPRSASKASTTPLKQGIDNLHIDSDAHQPEEHEEAPVVDEPETEPIQLQDFLNMTNIHFMELTTTKRRHTTAPSSATKRLSRVSGGNMVKQRPITFDDCVAAGFCTVPMLELYQHVSHYLKYSCIHAYEL